MNAKGGFIEIIVGMLLCLLVVGLLMVQINPTTFELTRSSTWSGDGTTTGTILGATGIIFMIIIFFWSYKSNVNGAQNF